MRQIGSLSSEEQARKFSDFLLVQGISSVFESDAPPAWTIWVHDEEQLDRARQFLAEFTRNPNAPVYLQAPAAAEEVRRKTIEDAGAYENKITDGRRVVSARFSIHLGPLTGLLIATTIAVFIWSRAGNNLDAIHSLFISEADPGNGFARRLLGLAEIRAGQFWRIFTPVFIHFTWLHILFNLLGLAQLGTMIESRLDTRKLAFLVTAVAMASNLGQYLARGIVFGGMSGVVYGLFGYIWIRGKFDPFSRFFLPQQTINMAVAWFILCFTGLIGPIANWAHGVGLLLGMAWGYLDARLKTYR